MHVFAILNECTHTSASGYTSTTHTQPHYNWYCLGAGVWYHDYSCRLHGYTWGVKQWGSKHRDVLCVGVCVHHCARDVVVGLNAAII